MINLASGSLTITLTGTPAFSNSFAFVQTCGGIYVSGATFAGSATGPRYVVSLNGVINTFGAALTSSPVTRLVQLRPRAVRVMLFVLRRTN